MLTHPIKQGNSTSVALLGVASSASVSAGSGAIYLILPRGGAVAEKGRGSRKGDTV